MCCLTECSRGKGQNVTGRHKETDFDSEKEETQELKTVVKSKTTNQNEGT